MLDIVTLDPTLVRRVSAPIDMESLKEGFENPDIAFLIEYDKSKLKGGNLLTYLANLDVRCDVIVSQEIPKEERFELMRAYMEQRLIVKAQSLAIAAATILTAIKNIGDFYQVIESPMFTRDEIIEFIEANTVLVNKWRIFMDSMIVYALSINKKYVEAFGDPRYQYPAVDDDKAIGNNFVNLFSISYFMELYYSKLGGQYFYFVKQFDEYMFERNNLFHWFMVESNPLPGVVEAMGQVEYDIHDVLREVEELEKSVFGTTEA